MPFAARKGDPTIHGGLIVEGSPDVTIGYLPAARLLDKHICPLHGPGPITETSVTVYINKLGAARMGDKCTCMIPSKSGGGGDADKGKHAKFEAKIQAYEKKEEEKFKEKKKEWSTDKEDEKGKDEKGKDEKKDEPFKPKLTAEASKELYSKDNLPKGADGKEKENYAAANVYEAKVKAKAGAEIEDLRNAKATAGAKAEASYALGQAKGKIGDESKGLGEYSGEAKLLTAKAEAGGEGTFQVKDGRVTDAYVEAKAGIGGSVVEAKATGKRSFSLFGFKVTAEGEASGALLTAEAEGSAHAGLKKGKFSIGAGLKIGAALAGLGAKFNITIEREEPKEEPKPTPTIPGVTGIDPIALGCMTVDIGGMPPFYMPGAPAPEGPAARGLDSVGKRNNAQDLTLRAAKRSAVAFTPIECDW
jgi:uncharacterized Zn-binding protein involved in type VI secretion